MAILAKLLSRHFELQFNYGSYKSREDVAEVNAGASLDVPAAASIALKRKLNVYSGKYKERGSVESKTRKSKPCVSDIDETLP